MANRDLKGFLSRALLLTVPILLLCAIASQRALFFAEPQQSLLNAFIFLAATAIFLRPKPSHTLPIRYRWTASIILALCFPIGIIYNIHHLHWIGLLALCFIALAASTPNHTHRDSRAALFILFWIHPLSETFTEKCQSLFNTITIYSSETLLHALDWQVMANDVSLNTSARTYLIQGGSNGAQVLFLILVMTCACGMLMRCRAWLIVTGMFLGLVETMILNILRITSIVYLTPRLDNQSSPQFLHDASTGWMVLGMFASYSTLHVLQRSQNQHTASYDENRLYNAIQAALNIHPPVWQAIISRRHLILFTLIVGSGLGILFVRTRPSNRAGLLQGLAEECESQRKYALASLAASRADQYIPAKGNWLLTRARICVQNKDYQGAVHFLEAFTPQTDRQLYEVNTLNAYVYLYDRHDKVSAMASITNIPSSLAADTEVAMIQAEFASLAGEVDYAAECMLLAKDDTTNSDRMRALFPLLARAHKYEAISICDHGQIYESVEEAVAAVTAHMVMGNVRKTAESMRTIRERWLDNPTLLDATSFLAIRQPDSGWGLPFENRYRHLLQKTNTHELYQLIDMAIRLQRPELAWLTYLKIQDIDSDSPYLPFSMFEYGNQWFTAGTDLLKDFMPGADQPRDLMPLLEFSSQIAPWNGLHPLIPFFKDFSGDELKPKQDKALLVALSRFSMRANSNRLSPPMYSDYARALDKAGQAREALDILNLCLHRYPDYHAQAIREQASLYDQHQQADLVYETLRDEPTKSSPDLVSLLLLGKACLQLELYGMAETIARQALNINPYSAQFVMILAQAEYAEQMPHAALHSLTSLSANLPAEYEANYVDLLVATGRWKQAEEYSKEKRLPPPDFSAINLQPQRVMSVDSLLHPYASDHEQRDIPDVIMTGPPSLTNSPFLSALGMLRSSLHKQQQVNYDQIVSDTEQAGRNTFEKSTLLKHLSRFLLQNGSEELANTAAWQAARYAPEREDIWRLLLQIGNNDEASIREARNHAPNDPMVWLVWLLHQSQNHDENWIIQEIADFTKHQQCPAMILSSLSDALFKKSLYQASSKAAEEAVIVARGYVPAYVQDWNVATALGDSRRARLSIGKAFHNAVTPSPPILKRFVASHIDDSSVARDISAALARLITLEPENHTWPYLQGQILYNQKGRHLLDAYLYLSTSIDLGNQDEYSYLLCSDAAYRLGNRQKALDLLRQGLEHHPDNLMMLNNLVYFLSQEKEGLKEALEMSPALLQRSGHNIDVFNTVSAVYLGLGNYEQAAILLNKIIGAADSTDDQRARAWISLARIAYLQGDIEHAYDILTEIIEFSPRVPDATVLESDSLLDRVERARLNKKQ
jgi:exosortase/archaeosortase family protein